MRLVLAIARGLLRARPTSDTDVLFKHSARARVSLLDIDVNLHLNNAKLLKLCEYARWEWLAQSTLFLSSTHCCAFVHRPLTLNR